MVVEDEREQHRLHACVRCDRQAIKTTLQKIIILLRNSLTRTHQLKTQNGIQVVECLHHFLYSFAELCASHSFHGRRWLFFAHILLCENGRLCLLCASISRRTENMMLFHQETSVISVVVVVDDVVCAINEKRK